MVTEERSRVRLLTAATFYCSLATSLPSTDLRPFRAPFCSLDHAAKDLSALLEGCFSSRADSQDALRIGRLLFFCRPCSSSLQEGYCCCNVVPSSQMGFAAQSRACCYSSAGCPYVRQKRLLGARPFFERSFHAYLHVISCAHNGERRVASHEAGGLTQASHPTAIASCQAERASSGMSADHRLPF